MENSNLALAVPEMPENSLVEPEEMSLTTKFSRLLCIGGLPLRH